MKYTLAYIILLFVCFPALAQGVEEARQFFNNRQYAEAGEIYKALLRQNPRNAQNNYHYALCCYETGDRELAVRHFEMAGEQYPLRNFYLGELYCASYNFKKSAEAYTKYLSALQADDENIPEIEKRIKQAEYAERLLMRVEDIAVVDSLVVDKENFLSYYRFSSELGALKQQRIQADSTRTEDKMTYTTQRGDRMFLSDSIGGKMSVFTSYRLLDAWSPPVSLPGISHANANENYPFLLQDGVTLYFASDGENSIGGYDIFITKYVPTTNNYLTPENIGMPFNSPYNDYMMAVDELNGIGWFATDRYQPEDKVVLYSFVLNKTKIILQSEDEEYIRQAAQMKTFRKAETPGLMRADSETESRDGAEKEFKFIVTDNLIYTHQSQFQSEAALKAWTELGALTMQLDNMKEQLTTLRQDYERAKTDSERSIIVPKILTLERNIQEQEELITQKNITIRNEEIKFIRN